MSVMIQIRNVPDELHRKLKARAAEAGMSLSAYLLKDVEQRVKEPSWEAFEKKLAKLKPVRLRESTVETIRAMRDGR